MRVVADIDIPFLKGVLEPYCEVKYLKGKEITNKEISDADAILVRTRTRCDEELLEGTNVRFIASATIGTDHIDLPYLKKKSINFSNAPGCNAGGVMQYVFTSLFAVAQKKEIDLKNKTIGVIGVGNTGGRVANLGEKLGFRVLRNDPPKAALGGDSSSYCSIDYLLAHSDIITCHVPLDETTFHLANSHFFSKMKRDTIFINASRGEVVEDGALLAADLKALILDVWNGEPSNISEELINKSDIATPHIAGYSYEGKINGTKMIVRSFAEYFRISQLYDFSPAMSPTPAIELDAEYDIDNLAERFLKLFPIFQLDLQLRNNPLNFEKIRSEYKYRREFTYHHG